MKHNQKQHGKKIKKKRIMSQKKKSFGCAKATNFELEIEDRGHLAEYERVQQKKRGDREDRTCMC